MELDADVRYVGEQFYKPGRSAELAGSKFSFRYNVPLPFIVKGASLVETATALLVFNKAKSWQLHDDLSLYIPISNSWKLMATAFDDYLRNAPQTFRRNYVNATVGIAYSPSSK
jgi:hypothetical protein